jgi:hypothetical protein
VSRTESKSQHSRYPLTFRLSASKTSSWRRDDDRQDGSCEERGCAACLSGHVYDERAGSWVGCGACSAVGRALVFVYPNAGRPRGCAGCGELFEVVDDNLTFFEGDELCRGCAAGHGVL